MRIAFITRSTLYNAPGGDTVQSLQTARYLRKLGTEVDVFLTHTKIDYGKYDLLHFFGITRPSDILFHINKTEKPFAVSPIFVDYSEYDKYYRNGLSGLVLRQFSADMNEYIKTIGRWIAGKDKLKSKSYLWKGQKKGIKEILEKAAILLPNSEAEYKKLEELFTVKNSYSIIPNGIDSSLFRQDQNTAKDNKLILCAARIEGVKNQLNLIKALNNTSYTLMLVGSAAPNQKSYYNECKKTAARNIFFYDHVSQEKLVNYYKTAKVHALPSWFETCGLSSLEAVAMGCNITITEKGYTKEYFENDAFYCNPGDPKSIFNAIEKAANSDFREKLRQKVFSQYTWQRAAVTTSDAYKKIISS
jgi:glycosyltransferase involved in cell wall biosynthesis